MIAALTMPHGTAVWVGYFTGMALIAAVLRMAK